MDLKTFECMQERVRKGLQIQEMIQQLRENIETMSEIDTIRFFKKNVGHTTFDTSIGNLTNQMKQAYIDAAREKIKSLEQEFAEL